MFDFIKLAGEKIKSSLEETIDKIGDKKNDIIDTISTTGEKVVSSIKTGKDKFIIAISNVVDKIKEKIDENNETKENNEKDEEQEIKNKIELIKQEEKEYEKEKYEAIGNNTIFTSDENWGICPITQCYMENPVITPSGIYYEKKAILDWIKRNPYDPISREYLTSDMLMEDIEYRNAIREYRKNHDV